MITESILKKHLNVFIEVTSWDFERVLCKSARVCSVIYLIAFLKRSFPSISSFSRISTSFSWVYWIGTHWANTLSGVTKGFSSWISSLQGGVGHFSSTFDWGSAFGGLAETILGLNFFKGGASTSTLANVGDDICSSTTTFCFTISTF